MKRIVTYLAMVILSAAVCSTSIAQEVKRVRIAAGQDIITENLRGGGFRIYSATDGHLIGYSDEGMLDTDSLPLNMQNHLAELCKTTSYAQSSIQSSILQSPLVTATWGQSAPFNNKCPYYLGSTRAATGCVATAMAQIMQSYQHPTQPIGSNSYLWAKAAGDTIEISEDFSTATYDWSIMPDVISSLSPLERRNMVATVMYHCGVAVNMKYGKESTSNTRTAAKALVEYFGYDKGIQNIRADALSADSLAYIIDGELSEGRPILYAATSDAGGRHAFLLDGADGNGYYHINWGWTGSCNGYFLLSDLTPAQQGTGGSGKSYPLDHTLIIGIQPQNQDILPLPHLAADSMLFSTDSISRLTFDVVTMGFTKVFNYGLNLFEGEYGVALLDTADNSIVRVLSSRNLSLRSYYYRTSTEEFSFSPVLLPMGTYKICGVYRQDGGDRWLPLTTRLNGYSRYVTINALDLFFFDELPTNQTETPETPETPTALPTHNQTQRMSADKYLSNGHIYIQTPTHTYYPNGQQLH